MYNPILKLGSLSWNCSCLPKIILWAGWHGEVATHSAAYLSLFGDSEPLCSGEESCSLSSRLCPR